MSQAELSSRRSETIDVLPLSGFTGAEITGIDLAGPLDGAAVAVLLDTLHRYKVVFFRRQHRVDESGHERLARLLGAPTTHPTVPAADGTEFVLDIDGAVNRASSWHFDVSYVDAFPKYSILRAVDVPPVGGDTLWANTVMAYASLPTPLKRLAEALWATHTNNYDYLANRPTAGAAGLQRHRDVVNAVVLEADHPVVHCHPDTGEKALLLGQFVRKIIGFSSADSMHLFAMLQDHVTRPEHTIRWRWSAGDLAIWDNRATQHRAIDDYGDAVRIMRRVTVAGRAPVSLDGRTSTARRLDAPATGG